KRAAGGRRGSDHGGAAGPGAARPGHQARRGHSPLITSPKRSKLLPLNLASCICVIGRKSLGLVLISIPGRARPILKCERLAACFMTFSRDRSLPHCFSTWTKVWLTA